MTPTHCARCRTELSPDALACPACGGLVHAATLKRLASEAETASRAGDAATARNHWAAALEHLPVNSKQYALIQDRVAALSSATDETLVESPASDIATPWWRRGLPALVTVALLLGSKLKFLLLGLTKASTFVSMFAFFGVYWSMHGWPLALGLVVSIYVHEMGHVAMLRRLGIKAGAPLFIPGVGALVMLKQHVSDPLVDAKIGLAGPVWGLGAALTTLAIYAVTRSAIWLAIAQLTAFINLFNLIPVWQLDGSRGMHVLARWERWALVAVIGLALAITEQRLLFIVGGVAVWRAFQLEDGPGNQRVLGTFAILILALALLAHGIG